MYFVDRYCFFVDLHVFPGQSSLVTDETHKIVPKAKTTPTKQHNTGKAKTPKKGSDKVVELLLANNLFLPSAVVRGLVPSVWFEKITSSY